MSLYAGLQGAKVDKLASEGAKGATEPKPGAAEDLLAAAREHHGDTAWVHSRRELVDAGWFGPVVSPPVIENG